jgi:hypothetical protein
LDALRRKTVLRRDETEPARARPCVGRSPAALSGSSTASLSTALAATELLGSQRVRERCELRVVKRLARVPEMRSISALRRENVLAALAAVHAAQHRRPRGGSFSSSNDSWLARSAALLQALALQLSLLRRSR